MLKMKEIPPYLINEYVSNSFYFIDNNSQESSNEDY